MSSVTKTSRFLNRRLLSSIQPTVGWSTTTSSIQPALGSSFGGARCGFIASTNTLQQDRSFSSGPDLNPLKVTKNVVENTAFHPFPKQLIPKEIGCPYLASKQFLGGSAHVMLSMAPLIEVPSKIFHFPLNMIPGGQHICPYKHGKAALKSFADGCADENIKEKKSDA